MNRCLWLLTLGMLLLFSPLASGQTSNNRAAASALFRQGRAAFDKGDYVEACSKFAESLKLEPAPGTRLNLAVCEERTGKLLLARQHLNELFPQLSARDERVPFAKDLLSKVEARISVLTLTLAPGAPAETLVSDDRDGKALPFKEPIMLDPGSYELSVKAPGRPTGKLTLTLSEGQRETRSILPLPVVTVPDQTANASPSPPPDSRPNLGRTLGFVAGGVGVASLATAAVTGIILLKKIDDLNDHCQPKNNCNPEGVELLEKAKRTPLLPLNTASWIIGLAGVGAGTVLILTSGTKKTSEPRTTAFATVSPLGGGFGVRGCF